MQSPRGRALLDLLAALVTGRRVLVLSLIAVGTLGLALQIPSITIDPTPEKLMSSFGSQERDGRIFREVFGDTDKVLLVLVSAPDVTNPAPLQYVHDLSRTLERRDWTDRVESVTLIPFPRMREEAEDFSLEALEAELLGTDGPQESLEVGSDGLAERLANRPDVLEALSRLVESDPSRFPEGYAALLARMNGGLMRTDPLVQGTQVRAREIEELRRSVRNAPLIQGRLIAADLSVAVVAIYLSGSDLGHRDVRAAVQDVRSYLDDHDPPEGVEVYLGGLPYLRLTIVESMRHDQLILVPITLVICMLLLYLSFRWLPGMFLPIVAVGLTAVAVVGGMALFDEPMNVLNNVIPPLLIIIGISDSIHLIGRYREELARTGDRLEAGRRTVRSMAVACLLTSATTAVGLASLIVSRTELLRHFGVIAAVGVMIAYLVTIAFLPSVLTAVNKPNVASMTQRGGIVEVIIVQLTAFVLRNAWRVLGVAAAFLIAAVYLASHVVIDTSLLDQFDETQDVYRSTRLMENKLDGMRPLELSFSASQEGFFREPDVLSRLDAVAEWAMTRDDIVVRTMSASDLMRETYALIAEDDSVREEPFRSREQVEALSDLLAQRDPQPLAPFLTPDGTRTRLQIKLKDVGARATLDFIDELEHFVAQEMREVEGFELAYTGDAYTGSKGLEAVVTDLLGSLSTAVGIIFVLLSILFRSVRLGLLSIPPNVIPLVGTMAYMALRSIPLNAASVIIFSISIGLAVDGTIHVLARFREETGRGLSSNGALIRAARGTGRAIVVSGFTLMIGFGVLMMSDFVPVRNFGELISVTVGMCLFATMLVQPALLKVAGVSRSRVNRRRVEG
ncbi:MAG: MMPL family transporter [Myxococcota bacterium]